MLPQFEQENMLGERNQVGLTVHEIEYCAMAWQFLCGANPRSIDLSQADNYASCTRFDANRQIVVLGADAYPGVGPSANARMSPLACLAHELAHWERFDANYIRPFEPPDNLIDEAETSLRASFSAGIGTTDRTDLIEDARDRLIDWISKRGNR